MNVIKKNFIIKDLENISGVKAHTIRIWEKRYNLLTPSRTETNIRLYSNENLQKLLNIILLKKSGIKISKIAMMTAKEIVLNSRELVFKDAVNMEAVNSLKLAMFQFDKVLFNSVYTRLSTSFSFRDIFKKVFVPFLNEIGLLWQTETLIPAHEHFISNLIAQKIQLNIEKIQYTVDVTKKQYVLFLPENEIHELGLLYLNYELVLRGYQTIYLGQNLPLSNLYYFIKNTSKFCFVAKLTIQPYNDKIKPYFKEIDILLNETKHKFIAIGEKTKLLKDEKYNSKIRLFESVEEFLNKLKLK